MVEISMVVEPEPPALKESDIDRSNYLFSSKDKSRSQQYEEQRIYCEKCVVLKQELNELRTRNTIIYDRFNELRDQTGLTIDEIERYKTKLIEKTQQSNQNDERCKKLQYLFDQSQRELEQAVAELELSVKKRGELVVTIADTLNVKLRYEQIILSMIENEKQGLVVPIM